MVLTRKAKVVYTVFMVTVCVIFLICSIFDAENFLPISMAFIIFSVITIPIVRVVAKEVDKPQTIKFRKVYGRFKLTYIGGGEISKEKKVAVIVDQNNFIYSFYSIPIDSIKRVSIDRRDNVTQYVKSRLTLTRMATLGIFSLAAPKHKVIKEKHEDSFLTIDYEEEGVIYTIVFSGSDINRTLSAVRSAKSRVSL